MPFFKSKLTPREIREKELNKEIKKVKKKIKENRESFNRRDPHSQTQYTVDLYDGLFKVYVRDLLKLQEELENLTSTPEQSNSYVSQADFDYGDDEDDDELEMNSDSSTRIENLKALKDLLDSGALTQKEFEAEKAKILNS